MNSLLLKTLQGIGSPRLLVIGDLMLDRYTWGDVDRVSPEAPVLILQADQEEVRLGGAASVGGLLRGLQARVAVAGVVGDDPSGRTLLSILKEQDIGTDSIFSIPHRITTTKERLLGRAAGRHPSQILRVDREVTTAIEQDVEERLLKSILPELSNFDAILISDYGKGVCTTRVIRGILEAAAMADIPVAVDPAVSCDLSLYSGSFVITPNRCEAELAVGRRIRTQQDAMVASEQIRQQSGSRATMLKLDKEGIVLTAEDIEPEHFPTKPRPVCDVTGAGDMVLAIVGLCCASGVSLKTAAQLANVAAGLEVEELGVVAVSRHRLETELRRQTGSTPEKVIHLRDLAQLRLQLRQRGKTLVLTNGCFDLLHVGHVTYLREAARMGDVLTVAINSDASVRRLKGEARPIVDQHDRASLLAALEFVDYVVIFDEDTPHNLLWQVKPDLLVKGGTYAPDQVVGREVVEAYGGRVVVANLIEGISTTRLLDSVHAKARLRMPRLEPECASP